DLGGVHVEASDDEHVLLAVGDLHVAARIHHADVASVEPTVFDGGGGLLRLLEIPLGDVVALDNDLAGLTARNLLASVVDDPHLGIRDRAAARVGDRLGIIV